MRKANRIARLTEDEMLKSAGQGFMCGNEVKMTFRYSKPQRREIGYSRPLGQHPNRSRTSSGGGLVDYNKLSGDEGDRLTDRGTILYHFRDDCVRTVDPWRLLVFDGNLLEQVRNTPC